MELEFNNLGLSEELIKGLKKQEISIPTEIQQRVIPMALENKDIIAQSETGTGKTLAYILPLFSKIDFSKREMQAVVLAPTHELAVQIQKEVELLAVESGIPIRSAVMIGDVNKSRQIEKLKKEKPHIIVGSAGRILELIKLKKITAHTIKTIVLDEGDRLLDKNNITTVKAVVKTTLRERQLMLFSASLSENAINEADSIMKEPEIIRIENKNKVNPNITHLYFKCEQRDKIEMLRKLVSSINPKKAIVFLNKPEEIKLISVKLKHHNYNVEAIYGTNVKEQRQRAMEDFRNGKIQLLVASDIAARGLDIKGVTHIFNLDMPEDPKNYLHRVGRTGRAGEQGTAISIITDREQHLIKKCESILKIKIEPKDIYKGKIRDIKK